MEMKEAIATKKRLLRGGLNKIDNKEEEYFRMSLLSF